MLMSAAVLFFAAPKLHAQDCDSALTEMEAALTEVETVSGEIATQRDKAIALAEKNRKQRDMCEGAHAELSAAAAGLRVTVADYERTIARLEARKSPVFWYAAGVLTPVFLTGLGVLIYLAAH